MSSKKPDIEQRVWIDNFGHTDTHHLRRQLEKAGLTIVPLADKPVSNGKLDMKCVSDETWRLLNNTLLSYRSSRAGFLRLERAVAQVRREASPAKGRL